MRIACLLALPLALATSLFCPLHAQNHDGTQPASHAVSGPAAQQANRVSTVDSAQPLAIPGHLPAWKARATDLGTVPDAEAVDLNFALTRAPEVQAAFDQLLADQQNPNSARYHQWLTPQQVGEQYGATQHDLDALTAWLTSKGFTVTGITPSRVVVQTTAPSAVITAALGTTIHNFSLAGHPAGERLRAPSNEPVLPAALASVVYYVGGLIDVPISTHSVQIPRVPVAGSGISPQTQGVQSQAQTFSPNYTLGAGALHLLAPADFNLIYNVNTAAAAGTTGTGVKVMIIGGSRLLASDLTSWESLAALPSYQPNYIVGPNFSDPGITSDGNQGEGTLDFERVYGTAPGATVDQVIAKNWLSGSVNANLELYAIGTVNDPIMSMSYSSCEYLQGSSYVNYESNSIFAPGSAQGISFFASSGDSSATGCAGDGVAPSTANYGKVASISDICASPYVTCVGGTQFSDTASPSTYWSASNGTGKLSALSYIPEGAWSEPVNQSTTTGAPPYIVLGTGGGPSTVIAKPSWQVGTGVPADGVRDVPDISFSASGHNAYFACLAYAGADCTTYLTGFSGTSASAPSMAGIAALANQKLAARQGNFNPLLYKLFTANNAVFHDANPATSGVTNCSITTASTCNNTLPSATSLSGGFQGFPLAVGYDFPTGLGSLNVAAFLNAAATGPTLIATTSALTAGPTTIAAAGSVIFTDVITPASGTVVPTGNVVFTTSTGTALGTFTLSGGTATTGSLTFPTAGTYTINAAYSGDNNNAASTATLQFTVTTPVLPTTTTTLIGTTNSVTTQATVSYTATVASSTAGTQTGSITFVRTSGSTSVNITQITLTAGKATFTGNAPPAGTYSITAVYSGDLNFGGSTSNGIPLTVIAAAATIVLAPVPANVTTTTPVTPVATVGPGTGTGTPTGSIQFYVDDVARGATVPLTGNSATGPTVFLPVGAHTVSAIYLGDLIFSSVTSTKSATNSTLTSTSVNLSPATASIASYQTQAFTATVNGISASVATSATVTFKDGTTVLGNGIANFTGAITTFTYTAGPLSVGPHTITATFNGDSNYSLSFSNSSTITVSAATITIASAQATLATPAGTKFTDAVTVSSTNFSGLQTLSCTVAANNFTATNTPGCSFGSGPTATTLTFTGTGSLSATLSLTSVKASATGSTFAGNRKLTGLTTGLGTLSLAGLLALCLPATGRRKLKNLRVLAVFAFLAITFAGLTGCGGNTFGGTPNPGTTAGVYTVTLRTTDSTGLVSGSSTVQLTIQ